MRKLASIQKVINIEPIEGKDRIELATVLGWTVITQKGQFKVGDLCIYIEVDSLLPEIPIFEFLRSRCWSKKYQGYRIRIMKMGTVYSYGIVFPLNILPDECWIVPGECLVNNLKEGSDVTKELNIRKYDPEARAENKLKEVKSKNPIIRFLFRFKIFQKLLLRKHIKLPFPSHLISKTDETRLQAIPFILENYKGVKCFITEKADGQSATYVYNKNKFMICSRNIEVKDRNSNYWKIAEKYKIKEKLKNTKLGIQGEIVGPGVANGAHKNIYQLNELDFYVFNIVDTKTRTNLDLLATIEFCNKNGFKMVPILDDYYILGTETVKQMIERAKGKSKIFDVEREGIVIRDIMMKKRQIQNVGECLSFKVINPDYLLKFCNKEE